MSSCFYSSFSNLKFEALCFCKVFLYRVCRLT